MSEVSDVRNSSEIIGNYIKGEYIGEGGFGRVYKTSHLHLPWPRQRCIKEIIDVQLSEDQEHDLLREGRILAKLEHRNIVRLHELMIKGNKLYMIMDYVDGGSLAATLQNTSDPLPLDEVDTIIEQIANGLYYLHHEQHIIHRDLKPHNILRYTNGDVVIADFGLAKVIDTTGTQSSYSRLSYAGTPAYMAPEHLAGQATYSSDLYSLGVITYQLFTRQTPFGKGGQKHFNQAPTPLSELNSQLSPEIDQVVLKMLAQKPEDRYQNPIEFARALHGAITKAKPGTPSVNPENIGNLLPFFPDGQVISLGPGDYSGPFTIHKSIHLIGAGSLSDGPLTKVFAINSPAFRLQASNVILENMLIQRAPEHDDEPTIQASDDTSYVLRHVTVRGKLTQGAIWQDVEWQLPIDGVDFGRIPGESKQERKVPIEVKETCVVETDLLGLAVFPSHLSVGPHTLSIEYNAQGKLPGMRLNGNIILRSTTETKTIIVTGQIEQPHIAIQVQETPALTQYESSYYLQDKAAQSVLHELGNDEDKDLLRQWQKERGHRLYKQMRGRASDLLFGLIGQTAQTWYVKRLRVNRANEEEEIWELILATDKPAVPDIVTTRKKTIRLFLAVHRAGQGKPKLEQIQFPQAEVGVREKDLASLPVLWRLAVSVRGSIPQELMQQMQDLPIESEHELDGDQVQGWEALLQLQMDQYNKQRYWVRYTHHDYRNGASKVTFYLDKDDLRDGELEQLSYQELQERTRKTKRESHMLFPSLPDSTTAKKGRRSQKGLKIGTLDEFRANKATMIISLEQKFIQSLEDGSDKLPVTGYLHYDAHGDMLQIERQQGAINALQQGKSLNPALPDFFFHAYKARTPLAIERLQAADLLSGTCNNGQIAAIESALAAPDLLLIQGPPGTGKTTVIAEICYQIAQRGGRTLIASQSNLAVDNALGRLIHRPSIRALRKGNTGSIEIEGRDFAEDRVVQTWLTNTADDCQRNLVRRQKNIALLEELLREREKFSQYYEAEKKWEKKHFSLQSKLEKVNREIIHVRDRQIKSTHEKKRCTPVHKALSTIMAEDMHGDDPIENESFKDAFQYIGEAADKKELTECINRCLVIITRLGFPFPTHSHLLKSIVWLKKTISASTMIWNDSKQILNQIDTTITTLTTATNKRKQLGASIQAREKQLSGFSLQIDQQWKLLQSLNREIDTLQKAEAIDQNITKNIFFTLQQFVNTQIKQPPPSPIYPTLEQFFSSEIITLIERDPSATIPRQWNSIGQAIQQHIYQILADKDICERASSKLVSYRQLFEQLLARCPEINHDLIYIEPPSYTSNTLNSVGLEQLIDQIDTNLYQINTLITKAPSLLDRFFESRNKQLLHCFRRTYMFLMHAFTRVQNMPAQSRQASDQFLRAKAHLLTTSFQQWIKEQRHKAERIRSTTVQKHDELAVTHKQVQKSLAQEEDQLSLELHTIKEHSEKLAALFQSLQQRTDLPGALRHIALEYAQPQASFLSFRHDHYSRYESWMEDIQILETNITKLWSAIASAAKRIKTQLVHIDELLEQQNQNVNQLSTEQATLTEVLRNEITKRDDQRVWWKHLWESFPETLRPSASEEDIYSLPFLAIMQQQFQSWHEELTKEKTFSERYDRLIKDWVTRLDNLSESERQELQSAYIKNANVIGITCGQVNKLNDTENRDISRFDVVIIDEVSKATPPEILLAALKGKKLILIGDQRQLPPMIEEKTLEQLAEESGQDRSAFRYLARPYFEQRYNEAPDAIKRMLHMQYRMHPDIMAAINQFYHRPLECGLNQPDIQRDHQLDSALIRPNKHLIWVATPLAAVQLRNQASTIINARNRMSGQPVFSYQSDNNNFGEEASGTSYRNLREVEIITQICEELQRLWAPKVDAGSASKKEIGVITFYGAQAGLLQKALHRNGKSQFTSLDIRIGTVDRFQGMERAIIIVSMVRNNRNGDIGFAKKDERINVAFSRAQELLIIVGCHDLFCVRTQYKDAAERYSNVAKIVRNRGDFIDISNV